MNGNQTLEQQALKVFGIAEEATLEDITNTRVLQSDLYALGPVLVFDFRDRHYYLVNDYSLNDEPGYVKAILENINHLLKGNIIENPIPQKDGAKYAAEINGEEYYLWESPLIN